MLSPGDSTALKFRDADYPFGELVPRRVRLLRMVFSDPPYVIPGREMLVAYKDDVHDAYVNSHGAVAAIMPNSKLLGLKPGEFEVVEYHP